MAEAEVKEVGPGQCAISEDLDDVGATFKGWRQRGKGHPGDWVMLCLEPLAKGEKLVKYTWIAHPDNPGKGGAEVCVRAAWIALMYGRQFDITLDVTKKTPERKEALERDGMTFPPFKFPNGKTSILVKKHYSDSEAEDEEPEYYGRQVLFGVRHKGEIFTGDTLSDTSCLDGKSRMRWSTNKEGLFKAVMIQDKFHTSQMHGVDLVNGKENIKAKAKAYFDSLKA